MSLLHWVDHRNPHSIATRLRLKRFAFFLRLMDTARERPVSILDVGGSDHFWHTMLGETTPDWIITTVNLDVKIARPLPYIRSLIGDATQLPFPDQSFDVVFSNSVIEHVGDWEAQQRM